MDTESQKLVEQLNTAINALEPFLLTLIKLRKLDAHRITVAIKALGTFQDQNNLRNSELLILCGEATFTLMQALQEAMSEGK